MQVGLIGLGRMGGGMAKRWHQAGHEVIAFNRSAEKTDQLASEGVVKASHSLAELVTSLATPRVIYVMVPSGQPTEDLIMGSQGLITLLSSGDVVVDAGNSNYEESISRAGVLAEKGIGWVDQGTSGGILGATAGYCVMVGGTDQSVNIVEPLARALAMEGGYIKAGGVGAGHFVKMVHNGMEYGMMESLAEGFSLLSQSDYHIDLAALAETWQHGSILQSLLLQLLQQQLTEQPQLEHVSAAVSDSGEGRWTIEEAMRQSVPLPAITAALFARYYSRGQADFAGKVLSALRLGFGGHTK